MLKKNSIIVHKLMKEGETVLGVRIAMETGSLLVCFSFVSI